MFAPLAGICSLCSGNINIFDSTGPTFQFMYRSQESFCPSTDTLDNAVCNLWDKKNQCIPRALSSKQIQRC